MITRISDQEFIHLVERVRKGKEHLDGKWNGRAICESTGEREQKCINHWFLLSEMCFDQERMRSSTSQTRSHATVLAGAEEHLEAIAMQMYRKGYIKTLPKSTKKGGTQKNDTKKSESYSLFESSDISQGFSDQWAL